MIRFLKKTFSQSFSSFLSACLVVSLAPCIHADEAPVFNKSLFFTNQILSDLSIDAFNMELERERKILKKLPESASLIPLLALVKKQAWSKQKKMEHGAAILGKRFDEKHQKSFYNEHSETMLNSLLFAEFGVNILRELTPPALALMDKLIPIARKAIG